MFKNKHFNAILTKFLLVITVMGLLLPPIGKTTTITAVVVAVCYTLAAYILADLVVLSMYGNRLAVLADIVLAAAVTWEMVHYMEGVFVPLVGLVFISLLIGLGEWFYHIRYLIRMIYNGKMKP